MFIVLFVMIAWTVMGLLLSFVSVWPGLAIIALALNLTSLLPALLTLPVMLGTELDFLAFIAGHPYVLVLLVGVEMMIAFSSWMSYLMFLERVAEVFNERGIADSVNSTIKLAQELDSRKFYAGALYQYLEAVRHYGMLDAPAVDAPRQTALKEEVAAQQNKLVALPHDVSIAQLFLERAASQIMHPDGSAPSPDELRSTQVILDQVLPAYFAAEKAPRSMPSRTGKTVTLTLVRWPYT